MVRSMLPWSWVLCFSILLVGPRVWDCCFSVGELSSCWGVARVSIWHPKVLPCAHLPRKKVPHTQVIPHILVWGSSFLCLIPLLPLLRSSHSPAPPTHHSSHTPLITHHSSHTPLITHHSSHTPLITHHSSHTTHLTLLISHHSSHTPLITHHSSHTTHHTPLILHYSSHTTHHTHHSSHTTHHTPLI